MSTVKIEAYATALFEIAQADGTLALVEDELFRVARAFESNEQLRNTLSDCNNSGRSSSASSGAIARCQSIQHHNTTCVVGGW